MSERITYYANDDVFTRARKILRTCNVSGADYLVGVIAEALNNYRKLDLLAIQGKGDASSAQAPERPSGSTPPE